MLSAGTSPTARMGAGHRFSTAFSRDEESQRWIFWLPPRTESVLSSVQGGMDHCSLGASFLLAWKRSLFCAFPPMPLILRVLNRIRQDQARVLLIAPTWLRQAWPPYLLPLCVQLSIKLPIIPHLLSQDASTKLAVPDRRAWFLGSSGAQGFPALQRCSRCY